MKVARLASIKRRRGANRVAEARRLKEAFESGNYDFANNNCQ